MKYCPTCNRNYSDETLNYCFDDRTPLISDYQSSHSHAFQAAATLLKPEPAEFRPSSEKTVPDHQQDRADENTTIRQSDWIGPRLATKMFLPPARQSLIDRPQLLEKLNEGLKGRLTILSAPAGFGKTSLITAWRGQSQLPLAWFSLDEGDNDPVRFADYLIGALQTIDENLGQESADLLQISPTPPLKILLTSLINEINELQTEFVLALDDYHVIGEYNIHDAVSFFIERLPPHAHALITSRSDPPFPLSRLRARGELKEMRTADLRFDETETGTFLNDVMKLDLSQTDIAALGERTEGWITGLQLSALSLQGRENKSDFVREFAGDDRFILDYLVEEVLNNQPRQVQDFLLRTSVLNRFNGSLCEALTLENNAHEMLEHLNRSNLFLIPLDDKNNWFRYHHLFRDLLQFRLRQKQANAIPQLQTEASLWCEENKLAEEAIGYALAAKDWERALSLIEPMGYDLVSVGKFDRLKRWIEAIPETALKMHPLLCFWYVPTLLYKDEFQKAEKYLKLIETSEPEERRRSMISAVWSSRSFVEVACGDLGRAKEFSAKAFDLLPPDDVIQLAVATHSKVACTLFGGDMKGGEQTLLEALPAYRKANHFLFETWARTYLGFVCAMQGRLREGAEELREVIGFAKENIPNRPDPLIYPYSFLCDLCRERNETETARSYLDEALLLIQQTDRVNFMVFVIENLKSLVLMSEACGDAAQSRKIIENGLSHAEKYGNEPLAEQINALNALIHLRRGDLSFADNWAETCGLSAEDEPDYQSELAHLAFVRRLIANDKPDQALPLLDRLQNSAKKDSRQRIVIEVLILRALAFKACGDENNALETLAEALKLGEPENFIRTFIDEGESLKSLLQTILKQRGKVWKSESPHLLKYALSLDGLFAEANVATPAQSASIQTEELPWWYANDPLSEREIEVLTLVAKGLSNQEIGNKLFIAAGTVKRHVNNIYSKLDVHSRIQAIELARKFGLIPPTN